MTMKRVLKVTPTTDAGVEVTEQSAKLSGNSENFIYTDDSGIYCVGPVSFLSEPENMRIAGMFRFPTAYEMAIPSTAVSPRPMLIPDPPIEGFTTLAEAVAEFLSELL